MHVAACDSPLASAGPEVSVLLLTSVLRPPAAPRIRLPAAGGGVGCDAKQVKRSDCSSGESEPEARYGFRKSPPGDGWSLRRRRPGDAARGWPKQ